MKTTLAVLTAALLLNACGGSNQADQPRPPVVDREPGTTGPSSAPVLDRRVILFEPRSGVMMILVNQGHSLRKTEKGRRLITLQRPGQVYKALSEKEMSALLTSLEDRGLRRFGSPFVPGDEAHFDRNFPDPGFRGILFLEEGPGKTKVVCFRPNGEQDLIGQERLKRFVEFKVLVYRWYNARAESEDPSTGFTLSGTDR